MKDNIMENIIETLKSNLTTSPDEWVYPLVGKKWKRGNFSWHETNEETYWQQLEALPPARMSMGAFAMGEPYTHTDKGHAVTSMFVEYRGRFFVRTDETRNFNPVKYHAEIDKQIESDARLDALSVATGRYLQQNQGTSEFDHSVNDISRLEITSAFVSWGEVWLGKVNLYGDERKVDYKLERYEDGQAIYNFSYGFIVPCSDKILEGMINARDKSDYTSAQNDSFLVDTIHDRVLEIGGILLIWA